MTLASIFNIDFFICKDLLIKAIRSTTCWAHSSKLLLHCLNLGFEQGLCKKFLQLALSSIATTKHDSIHARPTMYINEEHHWTLDCSLLNVNAKFGSFSFINDLENLPLPFLCVRNHTRESPIDPTTKANKPTCVIQITSLWTNLIDKKQRCHTWLMIPKTNRWDVCRVWMQLVKIVIMSRKQQ